MSNGAKYGGGGGSQGSGAQGVIRITYTPVVGPNPVWPSTLPQYPDDDGSAQYSPIMDPVLATSMETAAPKFRRRVTYVPDVFQCNITCTGAQLETLKTFKSTTLMDVNPFDWTDFRSNASATYVFRSAPKQVAQQGFPDQWTVSLDLLKVA